MRFIKHLICIIILLIIASAAAVYIHENYIFYARSTIDELSRYTDGDIIDFSDAFALEWDCLEICAGVLGNENFDVDRLSDYEPSLLIADTHDALIFSLKNEIVYVINYNPNSRGPQFFTDGERIHYQKFERDTAKFECDNVERVFRYALVQ